MEVRAVDMTKGADRKKDAKSDIVREEEKNILGRVIEVGELTPGQKKTTTRNAGLRLAW